ncbi:MULTISPECIES: hypothetical protein [Campylobacter]|uniref:hypothetical protein n=1 Tax=Campylobacter TaxID=194 RepID=UPI0023F3D7DD|nr:MULTISPECIES: hypothetical protein [Campylobacter]MCI6641343.1 hypothetical protein [Campylobacter sp.]MDD7423289.1 hypothetical protein [Campylobacter hominis]MDY3117717.1 hypothetical protein [Campylobacter hominis]
MFLNQLKDDSKKAFLDLALICAKADENLDNKEAEILEIYCNEMGIAKPTKTYKADYIVDLYKNDPKKYDSEVREILAKIEREPRDSIIILFELFIMIHADNLVDNVERDIINRLKTLIANNWNYKKYQIINLSVLENSARALASQMDMLKQIELTAQMTELELIQKDI